MIKIQDIKQELVISSGYVRQIRRNGDFSSSLNSTLIELRNQAEWEERLHSPRFGKKKFFIYIYCIAHFFSRSLIKIYQREKRKNRRKKKGTIVYPVHYCMTKRDKSPTRFSILLSFSSLCWRWDQSTTWKDLCPLPASTDSKQQRKINAKTDAG